jgi:hypothetical protein
MQAQAANLLARADSWSRGVRRADGLEFVLFTSCSTPGKVWMTSVLGCTCRGYASRLICSHVISVRERAHIESLEDGLASMAEIDCHLAGVAADHQAVEDALRRQHQAEVFERLYGSDD